MIVRSIGFLLKDILNKTMDVSIPLHSTDIHIYTLELRKVLDDHQYDMLVSSTYLRLYIDIRRKKMEDTDVVIGHMDDNRRGRRPSEVLSPRTRSWSYYDISIITLS